MGQDALYPRSVYEAQTSTPRRRTIGDSVKGREMTELRTTYIAAGHVTDRWRELYRELDRLGVFVDSVIQTSSEQPTTAMDHLRHWSDLFSKDRQLSVKGSHRGRRSPARRER